MHAPSLLPGLQQPSPVDDQVAIPPLWLRPLLHDDNLHDVLLPLAGRTMRQRRDRRFIAALVTCRRVHVAKRRVRSRDASPCAHRDEGAVPARIPGTEPVESLTN